VNLQGGDGVVSVTANVAPYLEKIMLREALKGHQNAAEDIDALLQPLHKQLFCESNPIPVKEVKSICAYIDMCTHVNDKHSQALHIMGRIPPGIRPPLARLLDTHKPTILQALRHADVFTDT
jgi:4-hydroxy-tetrahydrodipicolinate synthase